MNDFWDALSFTLCPIQRALAEVAREMERVRRGDPDGGIPRKTPAEHIADARANLDQLAAGDRDHDYLAAAALALLLGLAHR